MAGRAEPTNVDSELIVGWLRARSVARGLPPPVADHGGWRVETQLPDELRRYVFVRAEEGLRTLANSIATPRSFLKLCGAEREMRGLLSSRWQLHDPRYMMTGEDYRAVDLPLAPGYALRVSRSAATAAARIWSEDGALAASG